MTELEKRVWFPAKRYGWGWGFPITWQGWAVFLGYIFLILSATQLVLPTRPVLFGVCVVVLTAGLILICWLKGEKPRWRWGEKSSL